MEPRPQAAQRAASGNARATAGPRRKCSASSRTSFVTFPVHGISGFNDHLVTHATVTRVFLDCAFDASDADMERFQKASDCYVTYAEVIAKTKIHDVFGKDVYFEIFREDHKPPLRDLFHGLEDR
jgi:hypothetical protein